MNPEAALNKCRSYVDCQWHAKERPPPAQGRPSGPAITLSRLAGAGAHSVAEHLAAYLDRHGPPGPCPWTIFDRELVETMLAEHHLPKHLARFLPEDRRSYLDEVMEELVGLHPSSWLLVRQTTETILHLAEAGRVILVGRGGNLITARMPNVLHVRLVGSLEQRLAQVMASRSLERAQAVEFIRREDRGRARYLKRYFQARIDDETRYDLVLNTDRISYERAAGLIGQAALRVFERAAHPR